NRLLFGGRLAMMREVEMHATRLGPEMVHEALHHVRALSISVKGDPQPIACAAFGVGPACAARADEPALRWCGRSVQKSGVSAKGRDVRRVPMGHSASDAMTLPTSVSSAPISTCFNRLLWPFTTAILDFGTLNSLDSRATTASFALPSTGGAAMRRVSMPSG